MLLVVRIVYGLYKWIKESPPGQFSTGNLALLGISCLLFGLLFKGNDSLLIFNPGEIYLVIR